MLWQCAGARFNGCVRMTESPGIDLVRRCFEALGQGDFAVLEASLVEDARWRTVEEGATNCEGRSTIVGIMRRNLAGRLRGRIEEASQTGSRVIVGFHPEQPSDGAGRPLDGGIAYMVVTIFGGKITELKGCADRGAAVTYAETGALPPPETNGVPRSTQARAAELEHDRRRQQRGEPTRRKPARTRGPVGKGTPGAVRRCRQGSARRSSPPGFVVEKARDLRDIAGAVKLPLLALIESCREEVARRCRADPVEKQNQDEIKALGRHRVKGFEGAGALKAAEFTAPTPGQAFAQRRLGWMDVAAERPKTAMYGCAKVIGIMDHRDPKIVDPGNR